MPARFALALVVFVVSFGVGIGGTYLLIRSGGDDSAAAAESASASVASDAPARRDLEVQEVAAADNRGAPAAAPVSDPGTDSPADSAADSPAVEPAQEAVDAPSEAPKQPEAVAAAPPAEEEPAAQDPHAGAWWKEAQGRTCEILLNQVGFSSLSLRAGKFEHKQIVDWEAEFGDKKRLAVFRADESPRVRVDALGFDADGVPTAALVRSSDGNASGVIALQAEGKRIPMRCAD